MFISGDKMNFIYPFQPPAILHDEIDDTLKDNKQLISVFNYVKKNNTTLHFLGLLSDAGVHSHIDHLKYLLKLIVFLHNFLQSY